MWKLKNAEFIEKREYNGGCQGIGVGEIGRYWTKGTEFQLCKMNKFWRYNVQHSKYS